MIMNEIPNYMEKQKAEIGKAEDRGRRSDARGRTAEGGGRGKAESCPQIDASSFAKGSAFAGPTEDKSGDGDARRY